MENEIISQYKASLKMLLDTINKCPDDLWEDDDRYKNAFWRVAYHTLHYTALYLSGGPDDFIPWHKHIDGYHNLGRTTSKNNPESIEIVYPKDDLTIYAELIIASLIGLITGFNPAEKSGFFWLGMNLFELHLYNIRHVQHHTGQLIERLHQVGIKGIKWVGKS